MNQVYSGEQFIQLYPNTKFYKLTNEKEIHNGFIYSDGLNVDTIPFNSEKICTPGGLYFTEYAKIYMWINYNCELMQWVREVTIPQDALVCVEDDGFKANKIILSQRIPLKDLNIWNDPIMSLLAVRLNPSTLEYVHDQTYDLCLQCVLTNSFTLQYIKNQTQDICLETLKFDGLAIKYIRKQNLELCKQAVKTNGLALKYVQDEYKTLEICRLAIESNAYSLQYVKQEYQTPKMCKRAVKLKPFAFIFIKPELQTLKLCEQAVRANGCLLKYVKSELKTPYICKCAIKSNCFALGYVDDQDEKICLEAVKLNGHSLIYVRQQTPKICYDAVKKTPNSLQHVKQIFKTKELSSIVIKTKPDKLIKFKKNYNSLRDFVSEDVLSIMGDNTKPKKKWFTKIVKKFF